MWNKKKNGLLFCEADKVLCCNLTALSKGKSVIHACFDVLKLWSFPDLTLWENWGNWAVFFSRLCHRSFTPFPIRHSCSLWWEGKRTALYSTPPYGLCFRLFIKSLKAPDVCCCDSFCPSERKTKTISNIRETGTIRVALALHWEVFWRHWCRALSVSFFSCSD